MSKNCVHVCKCVCVCACICELKQKTHKSLLFAFRPQNHKKILLWRKVSEGCKLCTQGLGRLEQAITPLTPCTDLKQASTCFVSSGYSGICIFFVCFLILFCQSSHFDKLNNSLNDLLRSVQQQQLNQIWLEPWDLMTRLPVCACVCVYGWFNASQ